MSIESMGVYVGLDLGQSQDYTAIVVLQHVRIAGLPKSLVGGSDQPSMRNEPPLGDPIDEYRVRRAERMPLGTSYVNVIRHVSGLLEAIKPMGESTLIMDATGVGAPIVDMFKAARLKPVAVQVHGGQNESYDKGVWHVPKRDLIANAQRFLAENVLKTSDGLEHGDMLIKELESFRRNINIAAGHDSYEAWREGDNDDLVFALCLACWWVRKQREKSDRFRGVKLISGRIAPRRQEY